MYEDILLEDLAIFINNSIIRWEGKPIYVENVGNKKELYFRYVEGEGFKTSCVDLGDKNLDFTPVPLGMCNFDGSAYFLSRKTNRQWCQGLNGDNLTSFEVSSRVYSNPLTLLKEMQSVSKTIVGEYPSIEEATHWLDNGDKSVAFSRLFAIDKEFSLFYKKDKVGVLDKNLSPIFFKSKYHLEEVFYAD